MENKKQTDIIQWYLDKLNSLDLLKKEDEVEICKSIEVGEEHVYKVFPKSNIIIEQIIKLINRIEDKPDIIYSYFRDIDQESTKKAINTKISNLKKLKNTLNKDKIVYNIAVRELKKLKFNTKAINLFVQPLLDTHTKYKLLEKNIFKNYNLLGIKGDKDLVNLYEKYSDPENLKKIEESLNITPEDFNKIIIDQEKLYAELIALGLTKQKDIKELKDAYSKYHKANSLVRLAKNKLMEGNLRLVVSRAKRYINQGVELEDLIQEGNIGLMKAIDRFDFRKGYKFSTYATWWVDQTIGRSLADQSRLIRVPVHMVETINKIKRVKGDYEAKQGIEPSAETIASLTNLTTSKVKQALAVVKDPVSLETQIAHKESAVSLHEILSDTTTKNPYDQLIQATLGQHIRDALAQLDPQDEKLIRLRFGIGEPTERPLTLQSVGKLIGLCSERVRQLQKKVLKTLKKNNVLQNHVD